MIKELLMVLQEIVNHGLFNDSVSKSKSSSQKSFCTISGFLSKVAMFGYVFACLEMLLLSADQFFSLCLISFHRSWVQGTDLGVLPKRALPI